MDTFYDDDDLEVALFQMESAAFNFAYRYINDSKVRQTYIDQTGKLSQEYRMKVQRGEIAVKQAAKHVQAMRNEIMEIQRVHSSSIGRAESVKIKPVGATMTELTSKYANKFFKQPFDNLSIQQKNAVYLEIVESGGRPQPKINANVHKFSVLGRSLLVVTASISVYNIATAEDKVAAAVNEGAVLGGGFAGGAMGGGAAGLACGPGAPVCVTLGVFIGGALGALGADFVFGWAFNDY